MSAAMSRAMRALVAAGAAVAVMGAAAAASARCRPGAIFPRAERWAVIHYLRSLKK